MNVLFTKKALKDYEEISRHPALLKKANNLIALLAKNPYQNPPSYEKLQGFAPHKIYSRRINQEHRLVYEIREEKQEVLIYRMWTHYDGLHPIFGADIPPQK
jgi:toxin YoeB